VLVAGNRVDLVSAVHRRYEPEVVLAWGEPTDSPLWEGRSEAAAYVCRQQVCQTPARSVAQLEAQLSNGAAEHTLGLADHPQAPVPTPGVR